MFGLGIMEIVVVIVVALLVLGPERLPKVARQLGRVLREVRRVASDFQVSLATADLDEEREAKRRRLATKENASGTIVDVVETKSNSAQLDDSAGAQPVDNSTAGP